MPVKGKEVESKSRQGGAARHNEERAKRKDELGRALDGSPVFKKSQPYYLFFFFAERKVNCD